jgi:hypothetical protein
MSRAHHSVSAWLTESDFMGHPPRDPDGDDDESEEYEDDGEDDDEEADEPAVIREPDE